MKNKIPLLFKVGYMLSLIITFHFFIPVGLKEKIIVEDNVIKIEKSIYNSVPTEIVLETFDGTITTYGPDCAGCGGKTSSGYDVRNGNIYYDDYMYGKVRIIAADKKYPLGTIIRIAAPNISSEPIIAIVLDRGGAIRGNKLDLLFPSNAESIYRQKNAKCEVLRYGW